MTTGKRFTIFAALLGLLMIPAVASANNPRFVFIGGGSSIQTQPFAVGGCSSAMVQQTPVYGVVGVQSQLIGVNTVSPFAIGGYGAGFGFNSGFVGGGFNNFGLGIGIGGFGGRFGGGFGFAGRRGFGGGGGFAFRGRVR